MGYTINPYTRQLDYSENNLWKQLSGTATSTTGAGVVIFTIDGIPANSAVFIEYILKGKLEGADQFYIEQVTKRVYKGSTGNVVELSGATVSLSENFVTNPARSQTLGVDSYTLQVGSGGTQTVNWEVICNYHISTFNA